MTDEDIDIPIKRWSRVEYERIVEIGIFRPSECLELIDGLLLVAEPQTPSHFTAVRLVERALARAFGDGWDVRPQGPIALDETSEPEPDVAVVPGGPRDHAHQHPAAPVLVVEVAAMSLAFDRQDKASLYARARRPEYWIVNLVDRVLEVRRDPVPSAAAPYGWTYAAVTTLPAGATAHSLVLPGTGIAVADLLP